MKVIISKTFLYSLVFFILLNICLYLFIYFFNSGIPFNTEGYRINYHKFYSTPRAEDKPFNFLRSLSYSDAQWYLKIAQESYPRKLDLERSEDKSIYSGLAYAFFPLYPLTLFLLNNLFGDIELTAFIVANLFLILNFSSLYFVICKLYTSRLAIKTVFLIFLFPFSIFFRIYFIEGLFLFLLIWFSYFLIREKYLLSAIFLGLINITRGNGVFLFLLLLPYLILNFRRGKLNLEKFIYSIFFSFLPLSFWLFVNYLQTGNPLFFASVQQSWFQSGFVLDPLIHNIELLFNFPNLKTHLFHSSKIDILMILFSLFFLWKSKRFLEPKLWWIAVILTLTPILLKDTVSFSRFQSVVFPLFIYLANILNEYLYTIAIVLSAAGLLFASLLVVNWYWVG